MIITKTRTVKIIYDIPEGYGTIYPPTQEEYWNTIMSCVNENTGKYLKHIDIQDSEIIGRCIIPYQDLPDVSKKEVNLCNLYYKVKIYIEI